MAVVRPPVSLALAQPARQVPESRPGQAWAYESKVDGWRTALFSDLGVLQSRRNNDLAARFPEIVAAGRGLGDVVLDGELVALAGGRLDFGSLAVVSPRARAAAGIVAYYITAFDLLSEGETDWRREPYHARRARLEQLFADVAPPLQLAPSTTDRDTAMQWMRPEMTHIGIEGVVAKVVEAPYRPGRTGSSWVKIRQMAVVDALIVGITGAATRPEEVVLARRDDAGELRHIGLSLPLTPRLRNQIGEHVTLTGEPPVRVASSLFGRGQTEYHPVTPTLVVETEVEASVASFNNRLRPRVHRLRLDLVADDLELGPPGAGPISP